MDLRFKATFAASVFAALAILGALYFTYIRPSTSGPATQPTTTASSTQAIKTPDYTQSISFSNNLSADIRTQLTTQLEQFQQQIKTNPLDLKAWLNLGTIYKIGGDYPRAITAWKFIIDTSPSVVAPYANLGDVYMNSLKDYPKAEENFKKVIELNPQAIDAYRHLYTLYTYLYKTNTNAAKEILELGLKNNPGDSTLTGLLEEYNKSHAQ
jgi:tetratricopeptide (TPR) repeat protein